MRFLALLLLAANLTLLGYIALDRWSGRETDRLAQQINRDRIKLLTPQQVVQLGPSKAASLPNVCLEWGPFADGERDRVSAVLEPFKLGTLLSQRRVEVTTAHWVYLPPQTSRAVAERRIAELRAAGFNDVLIVDLAGERNAVSLGVFRTEEAARRFAERVRERGFTAALAGPRTQPTPQTSFVIRDPQPAVLARVREVQAEFGGVDAKTGPCPEGF